MIIDVIMYHNEDRMLDFRMHELDHMVDYHVIVESNFTFQGKPKESHLLANISNFKKFRHKMIHLIADSIPNGQKWYMEEYQRNYATKYLQKTFTDPNDVFIVTDIDEVPSPKGIRKAIDWLRQNAQLPFIGLDYDFYFYNFRTMSTSQWDQGFICRRDAFILHDAVKLRSFAAWNKENRIKNGGWHLTNFMTPEEIKVKLQSYSHTEYNSESFTNTDRIRELISKKRDIFQRNESEFELIDNTVYPLPVHYKLIDPTMD